MKILVLFISVLIVFTLTDCNNNQISNSSSNNSKTENLTIPKDDLNENELARIVADKLNVPEKSEITYEIGEKHYW